MVNLHSYLVAVPRIKTEVWECLVITLVVGYWWQFLGLEQRYGSVQLLHQWSDVPGITQLCSKSPSPALACLSCSSANCFDIGVHNYIFHLLASLHFKDGLHVVSTLHTLSLLITPICISLQLSLYSGFLYTSLLRYRTHSYIHQSLGGQQGVIPSFRLAT